MRGRIDIGQLQRIRQVRALLSSAAEAQAAHADTASRAAAEQCRAEETRLLSAEEDWRASLHSGLSSGMATLWAAALVRQQVSAQSAGHAASEAEIEAGRRRQAWNGAVFRRAAADDLVRDARKSLSRRREEATLGEAADRCSRLRGSRP